MQAALALFVRSSSANRGLGIASGAVAPAPGYPFRPRSNRWLEPGQFWAIPLADGRFGCGRVMASPASIGPRMSFVAGLMDWVGDAPPTEADLAARDVVRQGTAHIKTITETGGEVLGCRALQRDGLIAGRGEEMPTWGYEVVVRLAEHLSRQARG